MRSVTAEMAGGRPRRVRMTGALRQVRAGGASGRPVLQAELDGGADGVTLIWLGRDRITGIEPGRLLAVEGTLTLQRGRKIIYNPRYDLCAGPAQR